MVLIVMISNYRCHFPNRAGLITPLDGFDKGEEITMLVMPVMLNS